MSFYTSLSGLRGAQTALSTIANNVANASTNGFKRSDVAFGDLMPPSATMPGFGVRVKSITQQFGQGGFNQSVSDLDVAITGAGFLVTRDNLGQGQTYLTRNGSLNVDAGRWLTDSNHHRVQVLAADANGNVSGGLASARSLQLPTRSGDPRASSALSLSATLPVTADKPAQRSEYADGRPYVFDRNDPASYNFAQSTRVVDAAGTLVDATLYFSATSTVAAGDASDSWDVHVVIGDASATPNPIALTFGANGALTSPVGPQSLATVTPSGAAAPLSIALDLSKSTLGGDEFTAGNIVQDGIAPAAFANFAIGSDGVLAATFADGSTQTLGRLLLATVPNPTGLRQEGDSQWSLSRDAGTPAFGSPGEGAFGSLQIGAIERSNVDLTEELVALISAQRSFQANAKAIDAANTLTQTVINLQN